MPNHLIHETSPYLLQHAHNPVDWFAWGEEALNKARGENKPIFLSIGYAACHWCHVMERESFTNPETAQLLNETFVCIKVDREERPDLDAIYMAAVVAMTGQGGWPMSVFLTPTGEPFFAGTYFPPVRSYGMPAFREVLEGLQRSWHTDQDDIQHIAENIHKHLKDQTAPEIAAAGEIDPKLLAAATYTLLQSYDMQHGGWGKAPRFPQPMAIEFLLMQASRGEQGALQSASHALAQMSRGGMYDVVGGGFHRYSTDDDWLVPHFEKMLYDNAQLALVYLHAFQLTGNIGFRQICTETLDFLLREMTDPQGGFYSSLDADSQGEEGKYYVWTADEINAALPAPEDQDFLRRVYPIRAEGNFEGRIILQRRDELSALAGRMEMTEAALIERLAGLHHQLAEARSQRMRPATDDKVLVSWNALALRAFAQAAYLLHRDDYLQAAQANARFLLDHLLVNGRLLRAWRGGQARHDAYLEDHAALVLALLDLYQTDFNEQWYTAAQAVNQMMLDQFTDPNGGFFDTRQDAAPLLIRPKETQDNATPSGSAQAANALLRMAALDDTHAADGDQARQMIATLQDAMARYPTAFGCWLQAADFAIGPQQQIALLGDSTQPAMRALLDEVRGAYRPRAITAAASAPTPASPALLHDRAMIDGKPTAYVCEGFVCKLPVQTAQALRALLR